MRQTQGILSFDSPVETGKSILYYPGGKSRAIKLIRAYFPDNLTELLSPFLGGGSIEFACSADGIRVYGSDSYEPLVHFWNVALTHAPEIYAYARKFLPMNSLRYYTLRSMYYNLTNDLRRASIFYLMNRFTFGGKPFAGYGQHTHISDAVLDRLRFFHASNITIECLDWSEALTRHPDMFAYLDPPYALNRQSSVLYGTKGELHRKFDHYGLAQALRARKAPWVLSYNDSMYVRLLYAGFRMESVEWEYSMSVGLNRPSSELIITNT